MFIKLLNVAGALVRPNGMTLYSKWPWWVLNAVLYTSFSSILIWWYPEVHFLDNGGTTQLVKEIIYQWNGIPVLHSLCIESSIVDTEPPAPVLLLDQEDRRYIGAS